MNSSFVKAPDLYNSFRVFNCSVKSLLPEESILGLDFNAVKTIADVAAEGEVCQAANDNDPAQVVVSGHTRAVERAIDLAKNAGAKRALKLPVSAPFHCKLMKPAAERMSEALEVVDISKPTLPIIQMTKNGKHRVNRCSFVHGDSR